MGILDSLRAMKAAVEPSWLSLAIKIVREFEGCAKVLPSGMVQAYPDPATGSKPWTIGWGSTGADINRGTVWTQAQCDARLLHDLNARFGPAVDKLCEGVPTTAPQKAALVSFAYNLGEGRLEESTLLRMHRDGNIGGAGDQFLKWIYANRKPMKGLVRRREAERALYLGIPR